ncbi:MAG: pyridoxal-dependent decarboxylase [Bacteroidetes bacterium]|nr:pyridoxal-dependent decarboxylase [Bacteroidota bacterium]MDA0903993.1 pyridoxal-dependent decarboxylase [Bacteroidota bacterium]MDA1243017.1 pyridoxal-dependent decarboxylase [Bacteroidota bacterium]
MPSNPILPPLTPALARAYDVETFRRDGHAMVDALAHVLDEAQRRQAPSSYPGHLPQDERKHWENVLPSMQSWQDVLTETTLRSNLLHDPRYMGHQVAVPFPMQAWVGAWTDLLNNGQAIFEMGPSNAALEEVLMNELGQRLGLPADCGGILCHGGTLGNLVALLAAQQHLSQRRGEHWWSEGVAGAPPVAVLVSEQAHYCVDRAVRLLGWGQQAVVKVATDENHRMLIHDLDRRAKECEADGRILLAVVGSACTTSSGAFDPLDALGKWASSQRVWFHVDGAHGAPAAFSAKHAHLIRGIQLADSVVMDFHKLCGLPALCTGVFYRSQEWSFLPFVQQAEYLWAAPEGHDWWDTGKRTFECTKRMLSTRLAAVRAAYSWELWGELVDRLWALAQAFAGLVDDRPNWELAMQPQANIVCFRPADPHISVSELRKAYLNGGSGYVVATQFRGKEWLRCTFMNPLTEMADLEQLLNELERFVSSALKKEG